MSGLERLVIFVLFGIMGAALAFARDDLSKLRMCVAALAVGQVSNLETIGQSACADNITQNNTK